MTVLSSRPSIVRTSGMFKFYFYCPEKMSHIMNMCENTNYEDMALSFTDVSIPDHSVEKRSSLRKGGWEGTQESYVHSTNTKTLRVYTFWSNYHTTLG
jgi:hypothetical protein